MGCLGGPPAALLLLRSYFFFTYPVLRICTEPFGGSTIAPAAAVDPTLRFVELLSCCDGVFLPSLLCLIVSEADGVYRFRVSYLLVWTLRFNKRP